MSYELRFNNMELLLFSLCLTSVMNYQSTFELNVVWTENALHSAIK